MRSMQFGGSAVSAHNARIFNCSCRHMDSIRAFAECFYLLLCGCGVDFGLTKKYLNRLSDFVGAEDKTGIVLMYSVEDSIEGWADSVEVLLSSFIKQTPFTGRKVVFDYSKIRRKGSRLKTGGGKAPGYSGLKAAHIKIKKLLDNLIENSSNSRMRPIDAYDILMHCADAVLSGGIRRAATSVVFDSDDEEMMNAKTGNWIKENPQRARSNNSILFLRKKVTEESFKEVLEKAKEFGEPGFIFADHEDTLSNPCREIGFVPVTKDGRCGVQFCNLTSINGARTLTPKEFKEHTRAASLIGTLQAGYTNFHYLSNASRELTEEEALLGVSITGIMDNPKVLLNPKNQRECSEIAVSTNEEWAKKIKIKPAARVTCVKPEGTSSLVLGSASGKNTTHSVSCTVLVKDKEWGEVAKYLFDNKDFFAAVSLLSITGDKDFKQAPMEDASSEKERKAFDKLLSSMSRIDYTQLEEANDETSLQQQLACAGGNCEIN
jgi:ribonucleoside-diphosphate reductase alpha chain